MALIGILCAVHPRSDLPARPKAGLLAGGISLLTRGLRQLHSAGAERVFVMVEREGGLIPPSVPTRWRDMEIITVNRVLDLVTRLDDADQVLMIEEGVLVDLRLVEAISADPSRQALMVWPAASAQGGRASRIDPAHGFASVLKTSGSMVRTIAKGLGDWDLEQTLLRQVAAQVDTVLIPADKIALYDDYLCRNADMLWQPVSSAADEEVLSEQLISSVHRMQQDWPAMALFQPLHRIFLKFILSRNISGLSAPLIYALLCLAILFALYHGWPRTAYALALGLSLSTGLNDALRTIRLQSVAWHDSSADGLRVLGGALCLVWLVEIVSKNNGLASSLALLGVLLLVAGSRYVLMMMTKELTNAGFRRNDVEEQRFKLFDATPNTLLWSFLPFVVVGFWYAGLAFLAIYASVTFFWAQFRFLISFRIFLEG